MTMDDLERTVRRIAPAVLRFATGLAADRDLGADVAQEALAALVDRWRRHGAPDCAEAFAIAVARRRARRLLARRRWRAALGAATESAALVAPGLAAGEARLELADTLARIARLPRRDREALLLAATTDLSSAQAAATLRLRPATFRMRLSRARQRLRALLEEAP